jgi:hypothetical protein
VDVGTRHAIPKATNYTEHGTFKPGDIATSALLPEFAVDVTACFAAGAGASA